MTSPARPDRRTTTIDIITTLTDADEYTKEDIAELYGFRWNAELDIRSIKSNLNLGHVRCKSPAMVHRELWTTILAYNLIRTMAAGAALLHDKQPRQISFTNTCQYGRLEPRVLKWRRHGYKLMMKPRNELRAELRKDCT